MSTAALDPKAFSYISKLVRDRSAIVLETGKAYLVESRLSPLAREHGLDTIEMLVAELQKPNSQLLTQKVVEAMTTNETSFFRDLHPFHALRTSILPKLMEQKSRERTLSIWSNACSSGQEAFSVAMVIKEHFPELANWRIRMVASDLCSGILARAKAGIFNQTEINRGLPMPLLLKYFTRDGMHWKVSDEILRMVEFREINLIDPFPPNLGTMDIVFLRNVLIYFSTEAKTQILQRVRSTIANHGYLFLGAAETTMNLNVSFEREQIGSAVCYRPV